MEVNGITSYTSSVSSVSTSSEKVSSTSAADTSESAAAASTTTSTQDDTAAVYDKRTLSEDDRKAIKEQLKADQEKRQSQLTELVQNMLSKQATTYGVATDIWSILASGDFTVDAETKAKAQEDVSEDGYWGVEQTSDRIISFATALAGDDEDALEEMRAAFEKGYKQAEKTWGGELPEISQKTYDAVMEKFDKLMEKYSSSDTTEDGTVVVKENDTSVEA